MTESKFDYRKILSKYSIVLVLIVIMIACTFANSSFPDSKQPDQCLSSAICNHYPGFWRNDSDYLWSA